MLDAIRNLTHGWIAKLILALITIPFALFGIDSYLNGASNNVAVATIGGDKITIQEFNSSIENVRNRLQQQGQKIDSEMLNSPALKQSVLDGLITRRLVTQEVKQSHFRISDDQLSQHILDMPEFQENGKFSEDLYQKTLQQNKLTATNFENSIRHDMLMQQARDGIGNLAFAPVALTEHGLSYTFQQREVSVADVKAKDFLAKAEVTDAQVKAYYDANKNKFKVPEQVKLEFAVLSAAGLVGDMQVSDKEVLDFYQTNISKFQGDEQRQASHILIGFGSDKKAAETKAQGILNQLKANPKQFAELAIKNSEDTGSASKGGDLGSFGRGAMVKPFEDAVFKMKPDQISGLVESEYGYHIIKLTGISGQSQSLEEVKPKIKAELLYQKAQNKYAELSNDFNNMVYEQFGSLKPVADKFHLQLQTTGWLSKVDGAKYFKSDKVMELAFSDEVRKEKRNSEAVEVTPNNLVSVRVVEYKPESPRSYAEVKDAIASLLKLEQSMKLAKAQGEATLAKLNAGTAVESLEWIPSVTVDRKNAQGLTEGVMNHVFKISTAKLPAFYGFIDEATKSYTIVKVLAVNNALANNAESKKQAEAEFENALSAEYISAYAASLKAKEKIKVNTSVLFSRSE
jgi:peptidyl-prolyl cis-trans isomerase D